MSKFHSLAYDRDIAPGKEKINHVDPQKRGLSCWGPFKIDCHSIGRMSENFFECSAFRWWILLPYFVVDLLILEYFQSSHLIENLRFVEANQIMDNDIRRPNVLKMHSLNLDLYIWRTNTPNYLLLYSIIKFQIPDVKLILENIKLQFLVIRRKFPSPFVKSCEIVQHLERTDST